ncbi:hypothetical protein CDD83_7536 [Cordyceps sp. RAO-2017]|nr:hypothetical protein CDD83_7536 [Cordyceps sp. RAO-2017]
MATTARNLSGSPTGGGGGGDLHVFSGGQGLVKEIAQNLARAYSPYAACRPPAVPSRAGLVAMDLSVQLGIRWLDCVTTPCSGLSAPLQREGVCQRAASQGALMADREVRRGGGGRGSDRFTRLVDEDTIRQLPRTKGGSHGSINKGVEAGCGKEPRRGPSGHDVDSSPPALATTSAFFPWPFFRCFVPASPLRFHGPVTFPSIQATNHGRVSGNLRMLSLSRGLSRLESCHSGMCQH